MLKVEHLTVKYGVIKGVDDISFNVEKGSIVTLIGANGAGKTSTLRAISGLNKVASGSSIRFKGEEIANLPPHKIVEMGISHVPEGRRVFYNMTIRENILMGNYIHSLKDFSSKLEYVYDLFPRLRERDRQLAGTLSGGEQQMLAMARALVTGGDLILFDEPSMGLAPIIIQDIFRIIKGLKDEGKTILLIEQNANQALHIAQYAYVLENGRIALEGPAAEIKENDEVKKAYLGA